MITGNKTETNFNIPDTQVRQAIDNVSRKIDTLDKNYNHVEREIKKQDTASVQEGKIFIDQKNDGSDQKRMIVNLKGKLYHINLTPVE